MKVGSSYLPFLIYRLCRYYNFLIGSTYMVPSHLHDLHALTLKIAYTAKIYNYIEPL